MRLMDWGRLPELDQWKILSFLTVKYELSIFLLLLASS
jgi:hypothetical protein